MRFGPAFFSSWFLITLTLSNIPAHASFGRACAPLLAKLGVPIKSPRAFYLDEQARLAISSIFADRTATPEAIVKGLKDSWFAARLRGMSPEEATKVRAFEYHIANESFYGLRVDDPLEMLVRRPGMGGSLVHAVDAVHRWESEILNLEFVGQIARRPGLTGGTLAAAFKTAAVRAEWEIMSVVPKAYAREELVRIKGLRMDPHLHKFAARLLAAPEMTYREYLASQRPLFFGPERQIDWRVTNDPSVASRDVNRQMLLLMLDRWIKIDDDVFWTIKTAARLRALAQVRGDRPTGAAVDLTERTREMRREAVAKDWGILHQWSPRTREASLVMLDQFDLDPAFEARVRRAIQSAPLEAEAFVKVRENRRRLTKPWTH